MWLRYKYDNRYNEEPNYFKKINPTFPGSSLDRGTLRKHLFSDKLCRMEF